MDECKCTLYTGIALKPKYFLSLAAPQCVILFFVLVIKNSPFLIIFGLDPSSVKIVYSFVS